MSDDLTGLVNHSDRGLTTCLWRARTRLLNWGGTPSVGSKGDSYDNAMAESQFALFKTELIKKRCPWKTDE